MKDRIRIIIVDDNASFLEGISTFISRYLEYELIATFNSGKDLLLYIDDCDPDLILLDIEMPCMNGIETARELNRFGIELKLIAMSLYHDQIYIQQLEQAGFRGYVNKNEISEKLADVVSCVMLGGLAFPAVPDRRNARDSNLGS